VIEGVATARLEPLDADLTLYATDGRAQSDTTTVRVVERPFIGEVNIRAQFSGYLGRQLEIIPLGEPVRVPQGTRLTVEGTSSTELREVSLTRGAVTLLLRPEGLRFSGPIPTVSGRYEWAAIGRTGPISDVPPRSKSRWFRIPRQRSRSFAQAATRRSPPVTRCRCR
jgi:hypothetical protein